MANRMSDFPSEPCPWLLYRSVHQQIFYSLSKPHKIYLKRIPALLENSPLLAHPSGWFLLSQQDTTHFSLWNPTISDSFIHLPPLSFKPTPKISQYFLSSPPGDPDCKVLLFDDVLGSIIVIRPDSPHNKEWTRIQYAESEYLPRCAFFNGKLYGFTSNGRRRQLVTLDVDEGNNLVIESLCYMPEIPTREYRFTHKLVECCGELLYVYIVFGGSRLNEFSGVHVFRLDFGGMSWERSESLMGQAVFLDAVGASSFDPAFGRGIEADSVYFKVNLPTKEGLYSFNLTDGCLSVIPPCPIVPSSSWRSTMIFVPHDVRLSHNSTLPTGKEEQGEIFYGKEDVSDTEIVQKQETSLLDLPLESLTIIADCLNLFDYLNFRATCQDCRLIPKLQHRQALQKFKTCHSSSSTMWLLLSVNDKTAFKFVDPVHDTSFLMSVPESLKGNMVRYSKNGWLLMSDGESSMSFLNPFTEEIIRLPATPEWIDISSYALAFSSLPTSPDCIIVGCRALPTTKISDLSIIHTTMEEHSEWLHFILEYYGVFWFHNSSLVLYEKSFYLLGLHGKLSILKYEDEIDLEPDWTISWDILEKPETLCGSFDQSFLLECDGRLVSIFVGEMGKWLLVFSLDLTEMHWKKVENIGNYVIYVSRSSSVAIEARIMGTNNRIYFPRFRDNCILYYSLETKKFHFDGQGTVESFYDTKEPILATWIEPLCS
ncbi:F-box/kelch-repeat protein [Senna tora]|uniref:F-box/kelch-repeat protein n=1 Tax=Senna tora TaxID=362788 RepID=A0A834U4J0_9FABA|nr:F-box/kelch-repeat protein [Senna tora]